jgi:hypothetical protein
MERDSLLVVSWFLLMKYHGGTNFGRTAGGPFITTSYDYDAPIDEYGTLTWKEFSVFYCHWQHNPLLSINVY